MPVGGQLIFKGGEPLGGIKKKKKKRKSKAAADDGEEAGGSLAEGEAVQTGAPTGSGALRVVTTTAGKAAKPGAVSILTGKNYEEEFASEIQKGQTGQKKSAPWGSSFVPAPKILHGYTEEIKGDTAEKRLDIRCSQRGDKFCR